MITTAVKMYSTAALLSVSKAATRRHALRSAEERGVAASVSRTPEGRVRVTFSAPSGYLFFGCVYRTYHEQREGQSGHEFWLSVIDSVNCLPLDPA